MTRLRSIRLAALAALALSGTACASASPSLPSISPTPPGPQIVGKFVWYDLITTDLPAVEAFYTGLFGWEFGEAVGDEGAYKLIRHEGRPLAGVALLDETTENVPGSQWVSSMSVADVDDAAEAVIGGGGTVHRGPLDVLPRGRMAVVSDPNGALFALVKAAGGDPADAVAGLHDWLWTELWTTDVDGSARFYEDLVGYQRSTFETELDPSGYSAFTRDGEPRAGILEYRAEGVRPNWLPYVRVADAAATAERAVELGGKLLIPPGPEVRGGTAALIADPSGAALVVQEWTREEGGTR